MQKIIRTGGTVECRPMNRRELAEAEAAAAVEAARLRHEAAIKAAAERAAAAAAERLAPVWGVAPVWGDHYFSGVYYGLKVVRSGSMTYAEARAVAEAENAKPEVRKAQADFRACLDG